MICFYSRRNGISFTRYRCPVEYRCSCRPGALISLTTVRRHRDIALERLRVQNRRQTISLSLPVPLAISESSSLEDSYNSNRSPSFHSSISSNSTRESDSASLYGIENERTHDNVRFQSPFNILDDEVESSSSSINHSKSLGVQENDSDELCFVESSETLGASDLNERVSGCDQEERNLGERKKKIRQFLEEYKWYCGYYLRHNQTLAAMDDLLCRERMIGIKCWKTIRKQMLQLSEMEVKMYPYCTSSHGLLSYSTETGQIIPCTHPGCASSPAPIKQLKYIGLWNRLVARLQSEEDGPELLSYVRDGYFQAEQSGFEETTDFFTGNGFREYAKGLNGFEVDKADGLEKHLFLFISTDGAPAFRSSSTSFWPVIVYLGNIPPERRYKHRNIFPVLCIPGNPSDLESFMEPLYEELEALEKGRKVTLWDGRKVMVKCHLMNVMGDLPAKKKLCMIKGVNSYAPCLYCEMRGELSNTTNTIYYPNYIFVQKRRRNGRMTSRMRHLWYPQQLPIRDVLNTQKIFQELEDLKMEGEIKKKRDLTMQSGIIEKCQLVSRFESITPYLSMPIDLMHLLFENVAPQIVGIWIGDVYTTENYAFLSSSAVRKKVDKVLETSGSGIVDSIRRPRSLMERGRWKADEWRTFILTTSLPALHQLLPDNILSGWWLFCQICEFSMRPALSQEDVEELSDYCTQFFHHYSDTYYGGNESNMHLMKYTIHLLLHIAISTDFCGPLVCFSQFSVERFIGITKGSTRAKEKYSESVMERWLFEQSAMVCQTFSGVKIPLIGSEHANISIARHSLCSNNHLYPGYHLRGYVRSCKIRSLDVEVGVCVHSRLVRLYMSDLIISKQEAQNLIRKHQDVTVWNKLIVKKPEEDITRKYASFRLNRQRSTSFFLQNLRIVNLPMFIMED